MASRPELLRMMIELKLDPEDKSIEEMTQLIKDRADRKFKKGFRVSQYSVSNTLRKFLTEEYDYILVDKYNNVYDYRGNMIKKNKRKKKG